MTNNLPASTPPYELAIRKAKQKFLTVVADEETFIKEANYALDAILGNDLLKTCPPDSIQKAVVNVALTGLTLNPNYAYAYLVPRKVKGKMIACLDISYKGLNHLATKDGSVTVINAYVVYDWDEFDYMQGTGSYIKYRENLNPPMDKEAIAKDPKAIWDHVVCAFSLAKFPNGQEDFVIMPKWQLWHTFQTSPSKGHESMPWHTFPWEQMRKTVIKYHTKTLPKNDRLINAVAVLNEHEGVGLQKVDTGAELMKKLSGAKQPKEDDAGADRSLLPEASGLEASGTDSGHNSDVKRPAAPDGFISAEDLVQLNIRLGKMGYKTAAQALNYVNKTLGTSLGSLEDLTIDIMGRIL